MSKPLFNDLITLLKPVKQHEDIDDKIVGELLSAAITSTIEYLRQNDDCSYIEAVEVARMTALKHFDLILRDAFLDDEENDE